MSAQRRPVAHAGAAMIEAAFSLSLLILLLLGIMEIGRAFMTYNLLTYAVREGARLAIVSPTLQVNDAEVLGRINTLLQDGGVVAAESSVTFTPPAATGATIRVKAKVNFAPVGTMVFNRAVAIPLQVEIVARHE